MSRITQPFIIVTGGPGYEEIDSVRRITNFSTGKLATTLANFLTEAGCSVCSLISDAAPYSGVNKARWVIPFSNSKDILEKLKKFETKQVRAVFHAAALSDFTVAKVESRSGTKLSRTGKILSTESPIIYLKPSPKVIKHLRTLFPKAFLVGWKYEVTGKPMGVIQKGTQQILLNKTDLCVVNGPAYGNGFGVVNDEGLAGHVSNDKALFRILLKNLSRHR
ncbi:MAG: phosphopantothenoylcysteine decarboxylase [Verrucomicrobiota bacterium]|nr:phosphopantothenoylcysteine decarboxylase [Verrucomicrobiota bacterium]